MKWYVIQAQDVANSLPLRQQARPAHLARLETLYAAQRLLVAGPLPLSDDQSAQTSAGFTGSLIIAAFENIEAAQAWADADPYVAAGVYREVDVKPFMKVFPQ